LANQSGTLWSDLQHPIERPTIAPGAIARLVSFKAPDGQDEVASATPVTLTPWSVVVESSNEEQLTLARHFLAGLGGIGLIALIFGLIGAVVLSISLADPLSQLTESAEAVAGGDYARRTGLAHRSDEVGRLAQAFDVMVDRLQSAFTAHRASEVRHRHLFEALPLACWVFDCDTLRILAVNDAAVRRYGYSRDEFLSMTIADLRPQEDVQRLRELVVVNRDEQRVSITEWRHITKSGQMLNVETSSQPIVVDGHAARIAVIRDVTELRRAAETMQRLKERYLRLIREAPNGVTLASLGGKFIAVNPAFVQMLGYASEAEVLAINASSIYASPEQRAALIEKMNGGEAVKREEILLRRKDGSTITIQFTGRIVHDVETDDEYMEAVSEDVTEQRRVEQQFHQAQKMEAVGQLAGGIAHDFNNLLTVILNYGELLATSEDLTPDQREEADAIRQAARSAAALTRQLLILSRQQVVQPRPLHLNDLMDGVGKMLRRLIGENIELETSLHPDTGLVKADPGQIEQVLVNLAVNARDAMPNGGKLLIESKNVTLRDSVFEREMVCPAGDYVMLAVSDTGIGMDRATQARVFEPFFTTKEVGKGTGLGLATVYGIVKQSGGFVSLYSETGKGAAFKVYLPRVDDLIDSSPDGAPETVRGGAETLLLVEDQPEVRQIVELLLTRLGYRILVAPDAAAALTLIASHGGALDLLITDVVLPGMSGRELASEVAERFPAVKVLFISGYTDDAIVRHGVLEAGVHYLEKPFTPDSLASKVRHVLEVEPTGKRRLPAGMVGR
jgi:two-component system, cell cycle sensor histidine kinase and response regulator CckA